MPVMAVKHAHRNGDTGRSPPSFFRRGDGYRAVRARSSPQRDARRRRRRTPPNGARAAGRTGYAGTSAASPDCAAAPIFLATDRSVRA